ncbi:MAG TPA: GNAT family N-acetyltransferase, partial [Pirellulales bacterium]|nr:GNAT family N-acetyltransferase [Pirellulales bacterium]
MNDLHAIRGHMHPSKMAQPVLIEIVKPFLTDCVGCARRMFVGPGWRIVAGDLSHAICDECASKVDPTMTDQRDRNNGRSQDGSLATILETERLLLREIVPDDAAALYALDRDPEVVRHTGGGGEGPRSVEEARAGLVARSIADYRRYGFGRCGCVWKATGELIGMCGLKYLDELG